MTLERLFLAECLGRVLIVTPRESISSLSQERVRDELEGLSQRIEEESLQSVVIDFVHVSYFGSSMLAAMHRLWRQVESHGGKLVLCNLSEVGREVMHVSRFDTLWPACPTRDEAVRAAQA